MALVQHYPSLNPAPAPVCSVCIANYNGVHVLGDCIDSVLAQEGAISVEIIVHDDASTDGSMEWIRQRYPTVELLVSEENAGFCIANNRMVERARGEFVLLLNNDAALHPDALSTLLSAAREQSRPGIFTLPQFDWQSDELVDRGCRLDPFYNPVPNLDPDRHDVAYVIGACMFLPRELWIHLGGFPEWFGSIAEDMYLCCLARIRGLPVVAVPKSGYRHRQGASFGGNRINAGKLQSTYRRRVLSERNKTAVMVICTPTAWVWPLLMVHCVLLVVEGATLALMKRDAGIWREVYRHALGCVLRSVGEWRARRRDVQRSRQVGLLNYLRGFVCTPRKFSLLLRHGVPDLQ
jgi:GT2 family glycosyltransferase